MHVIFALLFLHPAMTIIIQNQGILITKLSIRYLQKKKGKKTGNKVRGKQHQEKGYVRCNHVPSSAKYLGHV